MVKLVIKDAQPVMFMPLQAMYSGDTIMFALFPVVCLDVPCQHGRVHHTCSHGGII